MKIEYKKDGIVVDNLFYSLIEITNKCNKIKLEDQELVLLELGWDGRGGSVFEQRALPLKNVLRIKDILLDKEVYFGEIWGKHSEVCGTICEKTIRIIKDKDKVLSFLKEFPSGIDYDYSFIDTFIEREEESLEYRDEDDDSDITQELLDELKSLL